MLFRSCNFLGLIARCLHSQFDGISIVKEDRRKNIHAVCIGNHCPGTGIARCIGTVLTGYQRANDGCLCICVRYSSMNRTPTQIAGGWRRSAERNICRFQTRYIKSIHTQLELFITSFAQLSQILCVVLPCSNFMWIYRRSEERRVGKECRL